MLSQEYQAQGKSFKTKHEEIAAAEKKRRADIVSNFDNHFNQIKTQMDDEFKSMCNEEGEMLIEVETRELEAKYNDLVKEIADKTQ